MAEFLPAFYDLVKPGMRVLDLGAGPGQQSLRLAQLGARVTAVDRSFEPVTEPGIVWRKMTIEDWLSSGGAKQAFDAVLARNVFPFMDKAYVQGTLVPAIAASMPSGGVFAIAAFFKEPEPPFARQLSSLWTVEELVALFPGWEKAHAWTGSSEGPDMQGALHAFHKSEVIMKKP